MIKFCHQRVDLAPWITEAVSKQRVQRKLEQRKITATSRWPPRSSIFSSHLKADISIFKKTNVCCIVISYAPVSQF